MFPTLNFPPTTIKIENKNDKDYVFDPVRKKWIILTPEEWVRQNVIAYFNTSLKYPLSHMAVEQSLKLNKLTKRADLLVYDRNLNPFLLVECKSYKVKLRQQVMEQISRYNLVFKVPWLLVTNGLDHFGAYIEFKSGNIEPAGKLPDYHAL